MTASLIRRLIWRSFFLIIVALKQLEKLHVEHAEHPVQCAYRGRMGRALQDDLRVRLRLLENGHFSFFRRGVSREFRFETLIEIWLLLNGHIFFSSRVATGNPMTFTLTPPEAHMEIRSGYGTTGARVSGPVRVGDPLTLVVYMRSQFGKQASQFDQKIQAQLR